MEDIFYLYGTISVRNNDINMEVGVSMVNNFVLLGASEEWISYRGGMGNRIDGFMVLDRINNELDASGGLSEHVD